MLARQRKVETMIENIAHQHLSADLKDLSQMVYLILLEYDDARLQDLWDNGQIDYFIARIIVNQYKSTNSPFHTIFRKFRLMVDESIQISHGGRCCNEDLDIFESNRVLNNED